jgi:hypothetical protein
MKRFLVAAVVIGAFVIPLATADASTTPSFQARVGKIWGLIPPTDTTTGMQVPNSAPGSGSLYYNGGPIMPTSKVYTIFWQPSGYTLPAGYADNLNQYFKDLQADNGKNTNTYVNATQYYQVNPDGTKTYVQNKTTFGGTTIDTNPLPPTDVVNCPDIPFAASGSPAGNQSATADCVTDDQLHEEISNVIKAKGWPVNNQTEFFVFTAPNIGTCFPAIGVGNATVPLCSYEYFCAYHSAYFDSTINPNSQIIYSNMPFAAETYGNPVTCDLGEYPNNNPSDPEISITSHEHSESITDPFGTGWWDSNPNDASSGYENGDMCAWDFGTTTGDSGDYLTEQPGVAWNQTINGHHYLMQLEWDNTTVAQGGCPGSDANGNPTSHPNYDTPEISLTPNTGVGGIAFKILGLFFAAGDTVTSKFVDSGVTTALANKSGIQKVVANASGQFSFATKAPAKAKAGTATVTSTGKSGTASSTFTVSPKS